MNDLLQQLEPDPRITKSRGVPLMVEFPVNTATAPYLVSTSHGLLWVREPLANQVVRAAVRHIKDDGPFFREVLDEIIGMGQEAKWGNVSEGTHKGVNQAIEYVRSYDLPDIELISAVKELDQVLPGLDEFGGCPIHRVDWMLGDMVVAVPADRSYVGFLSRFGSSRAISVIHNPSRGLGVAKK